MKKLLSLLAVAAVVTSAPSCSLSKQQWIDIGKSAGTAAANAALPVIIDSVRTAQRSKDKEVLDIQP